MTIDLLLCDKCAKQLENLFPDVEFITDNEYSTDEDIKTYLNLSMQMKKVEKCEICQKQEIKTSKSHFIETQSEFEDVILRLLRK